MLAEPVEMARFSAWANARLHAAAATLPAAEVARDRGAFFGSILGTLNHILLVDMLYRERLEGRETRFESLDETVHDELAPLTAAQAAEDAYYIDYFARLDAGVMERGGGGADIGPLMRDGVPGLALRTVGEHYLDWHHTEADTLDKVDLQDFRKAMAMLGVVGYVLADMPGKLPRGR